MTPIIAPNKLTFGDQDRQKIAGFKAFKDQTGHDLMSVTIDPLSPADQERHRLYLLLLMRLVENSWNGNRKGATGEYPYRATPPNGVYGDGKEYRGHNIAAIAVHDSGKVIDFDFNHNEVFRSSVEHAEARLTRRLFSLTGLREISSRDPATEGSSAEYATMLKKVTIYTSLEPCAQCAGVMALAQVKAVIYLQADDGAMRIANVLKNLKPYNSAATPIQVTDPPFDGIYEDVLSGKPRKFDFGDELDKRHRQFQRDVMGGKPFWKPVLYDKAKEDPSQSLASFLCTDEALTVYQEASEQFDKLKVKPETLGHPDHRPSSSATLDDFQPMSNLSVLKEVQEFFAYAKEHGFRGTPH